MKKSKTAKDIAHSMRRQARQYEKDIKELDSIADILYPLVLTMEELKDLPSGIYPIKKT